MAMLQVECLKKIYTTRFGGNQVQALSDVSFSVETGEYVAIMGESGSGKTTLLNILAALDQPTSGKVFLDGKDLTMVKEREIAAFRRDNLGFVFQDFNLLDTFPLKDNIFLPLVLAGKSPKEMELRLKPIAEQLGITHLLEKYPYEVSGGCQSVDFQAEADSGGRTDRSTGFQVHRWLAGCLFRNSCDRTDNFNGNTLHQGGKPCRPDSVHQGRRAVPSDLSGRLHE